MSTDNDWEILGHYPSQTEARVVESFLVAAGFEVQLLDTHTHAFAPVRGDLMNRGMRLIVRKGQVEAARQVLAERQEASHLSIVDGPIPKVKRSGGEWIIIAIMLIIGLAVALSKNWFN